MKRNFLPLFFIMFILACGNKENSNTTDIITNNEAQEPVKEEKATFKYPKGEAQDTINKWVDSLKVNIDLPHTDEDYFSKSLFIFYKNRDFKPAWDIHTSKELINFLKQVENEGLNSGSYPLDTLQSLFNKAKLEGDAKNGAKLDFLLSASYLKVADVIATGKVKPGKYSNSWHIKPEKPDELHAQLEQAINGHVDKSLDFFRPQYLQYNKLLEKIDRYSKIINEGGWPKVPAGENLVPGDSSERVYLLRKRLYISGDLKTDPDRTENPYYYDSALIKAITHFQMRHGLEQEAIVGENTISSLNVPAKMRQKQIMLNLDRIRWFASGDMPPTYVLVNIPEYRLRIFEKGKQIKTMKVVVGEVMNTTPVFSDYIEYAIFSPFWNVPESIAEEEIWPKAKKDPNYLREHHYEVLIGWGDNGKAVPYNEIKYDRIDEYNYRIRQKPGPWNALGRVKYMFPNDFAIYLHDTPANQLFDKQHRAFSHGCIRIEDPVWFGDWLFTQYAPSDIRRKMTDGERDIVGVKEHVPVYILYLTAFVDKEGRMNFRKDLYELDKQLAQEFDRI